MFKILKSGGLVMIPLVLASIVMVGIILERFWTLRRSAVIPAKLGAEVRAWARSAKIERDHLEKLRTNSPVGAILAAGVARHLRPGRCSPPGTLTGTGWFEMSECFYHRH